MTTFSDQQCSRFPSSPCRTRRSRRCRVELAAVMLRAGSAWAARLSDHLCWRVFFTFELLYAWVPSSAKIVKGPVFYQWWLSLLAAMHYINQCAVEKSDRILSLASRYQRYPIRCGSVLGFIHLHRSIGRYRSGRIRFSVHYTVDLVSTNISIPQHSSMYPDPRPRSSTLSRCTTTPMRICHAPTGLYNPRPYIVSLYLL